MTPLTISNTQGLDAALIMFRASPENKNCSFLFIEGESDEKFWHSRIEEKKCCIVFLVSFSENNKRQTGKTAVIKNIRTLNNSKVNGFLGIIDNDFDALMCLPRENNTCVADTHDLETLLLRSPTVFKKMLAEFGDNQLIANFEKKEQKSIQDYLIELALPFAQLEWLKQQLKPGLELNDLHKNNTILIPDTWCLSQANLNAIVNARGMDINSEPSQHLLKTINNIDPWLLCNGHKMIDILSMGFQNGILGNNKKAITETIASYIRGSIDKVELYQTELCQSMFIWQNNNSLYQVLI
ncbi:DUF4435 domain-containing protein [Methylobacter sp. G7]|uniref:DUF4435 domain-containing protein n=1 Tax=Methylobacter sp. G7 TaxID=3230117 RepID=UPI003D8052B4